MIEFMLPSFKLVIGATALFLAWFLIRKDPRQIYSGSLIVLATYCLLSGFLNILFPNRTLPSGELALGVGSEILNFLYFILLFLIAIAGLILIISGWKLVRRQKPTLAHLLPLLFGLLCITFPFVCIALLFFASAHPASLKTILIFMRLILYIPMLLISYLISAGIYRLIPKTKKPSYLLVLGAGLAKKKEVGPLLANRLNKTIELFNQSQKQNLIIVSGGQGDDELVAEAEAMKNYLLGKQIPITQIIVENKSTNTKQNMQYSQKIIAKQSISDSGLFVTNNYHVLRAAILARKTGLNAQGVGCKTAFNYLLAGLIREYIAIMVSHWKLFIIYTVLVTISVFV